MSAYELGFKGGETGLEIAIVGMACRLPGANDVEAFWRNLRGGVESIRFSTDEELALAGVPEHVRKNPQFVPAFGALEGVEYFDASFFGVHPREAERMDPQHRVFLECAFHALEDAGYDPERYPGLVGVFAGSGLSTYLLEHLYRGQPMLGPDDGFQVLLGNDKEFMVSRAAYKMNLRGPACAIQTACSTSLVAVHAACQSLLGGESDCAVAGGASIMLPQDRGYLYHEDAIASPDGHCRAYDARAGGTVVGNGVGLVVLKRLRDAIQDRDTIRAVIKGSAVNNDGSKKVSYTAPRASGQAEVIRAAMSAAGVSPDTISYVEGHGTGTPMGDPIEVAALAEAFQGAARQGCALGSVKTNVGHLNSAAGVAGLIKTALSLEHAELPPSLHYETPNPKIDFASGPFYVNAKLRPWHTGGAPRRAGVSSFGIGGTNAHVVVEEAPEPPPPDAEAGPQLLVLSARSPRALEKMTAALAARLASPCRFALADAAYTLQVGRRHFAHRRAAVAATFEQAVRALASRERPIAGEAAQEPLIAFLAPGQGAQYARMGEGLYRRYATFRSAVDRCSERLRPLIDVDLRSCLMPAPGDEAAAEARLAHTAITQPAMFVVGCALAALWAEFGIAPGALLGHSVGELVAAHLAGVFSLDDALGLVATRARLLASLPPGAMLAVPLNVEALELPQGLGVAAVNAGDAAVVSGPVAAVEAFAERLASRGVTSQRLRVSHAFHSPMVDAVASDFEAAVRRTPRSLPAAPVMSNVTGTWLEASEATSPEYWAAHLRKPVLFDRGLRTLLQGCPGRGEGPSAVVELGPGRGLTSLARRASAKLRGGAKGPGVACVPSLRHANEVEGDEAFWLRSAGHLFATGHSVAFEALHGDAPRRRVPLPGYAFERQRYWVERIDRDGEAQKAEGARPAPAVYERPEALSAVEPPRTELERTLASIFSELLGIEPVGIHDNFFELGGQSLLAAELSAKVSSATGLRLRAAQLFEAPTVAELAARLGAPGDPAPSAPGGAPAGAEFEADLVLGPEVDARGRPAPSSPPETILLTGATGFLGAFLAHELLTATRARVLCLVRAGGEAEGRARVRGGLLRYGLSTEAFDERVEIVCGDIAAREHLGAGARHYAALCERVDAVFHAGALVNFAHPYRALRAANVEGTRALLRFATEARIKPLHFASTAAIFSAPYYESLPRIYEHDSAAHGAGLRVGYQQSKWVADRLVAAAGARGVPVTIHRPATVGGHSVTGAFNRSDYVFTMLLGCLELGSAPEGDYALHFAPVDDVARAMVALSLNPASFGKAFHLVSPAVTRMSDVLNMLRSLGYPIEIVPYAAWREAILRRASADPKGPLRAFTPLLADELHLPDLALDTANATRGLEGTGAFCRPLDRALLKTYCQRFYRDALVSRSPE